MLSFVTAGFEITEKKTLEEFDALGVEFISLSESVDTSKPMGKMVYTVIAAVAELERSLIRERVVIGLQKAKAQGKKLGRPRLSIDVKWLRKLKSEGLSLRAIARETGISRTTVSDLLSASTG